MAHTTPTELDKALAFVQENPDEIHVFYNTFLNSVLYLPTHDGSQEDAETSSDKQLRPIFAQSGETLFLLLFDSLEKLSAWAKKDVGYVGLKGQDVLEMMDPKFHWFLNYGSEHGRAFGSDEIAWLKGAVQRAGQTAQASEISEDVRLEVPNESPAGLVDALREVAVHNKKVLAAALGHFYMPSSTDQPDLALAVRFETIEEGEREAILDAFTDAARTIIKESDEFWVFIAGVTDLAERLMASVEPFYVREN